MNDHAELFAWMRRFITGPHVTPAEAGKLIRVLALAMAHDAAAPKKRGKILARLAEGPATNRDLQILLGLPSRTVAKHIWHMRAAGLVTSQVPYRGARATYELAAKQESRP